MKIWLLSPYNSGSHQAWANGYIKHSRHEVCLLPMAGRFWKWRMQGGAIELAAQARHELATNGPPDVVLATDMVNLPAWLGLLRADLPHNVPVVLYMHENQLTYPWREGEGRDLTYGMINWLSQLAADSIWFNSRYHLESWFDELPRMLKHYPDYNHLQLVEPALDRSRVLPVGIDCSPFLNAGTHSANSTDAALHDDPLLQNDPLLQDDPLIAWNQRWEYDKRPDRFFALLRRLDEAGAGFRLAVAGENFRNVPKEFEEAREQLGARVNHWGYVESRQAYAELLRQADLVISTADHEFFGISILEAICAGAHPLLPNRLSYPELIPQAYHDQCLYADEEALFQLAVETLERGVIPLSGLQDHIRAHYEWPVVASLYDDVMQTMV